MQSFIHIVRVPLFCFLLLALVGCELPQIGNVTIELETSKTSEDSDESEKSEEDYRLIQLSDSGATSSAKDVSIVGNRIMITDGGEYKVTGSLSDGQIIVDAEKEDVEILFEDVSLKSETSAPIYIKEAKEVQLSFAANSTNVFQNTDGLVYTDVQKQEPNSVIFSASDLILKGADSARVEIIARFGDGINADEDLEIKKINMAIEAEDDGIRGKNSVEIKESDIVITAKGDGIKSDNSTDENKGAIELKNNNLEITSGGDGLVGYTGVSIDEGVYIIESGGGSDNSYSEDTSMKGIKVQGKILIKSGNITISSADDALHSDGAIQIKNGVIEISSGDDGIHANDSIEIDDGNIDITKSYEGIESKVITINGGNISIVSQDDGLNVSGGNDGSGTVAMGGRQGGGFNAVLEGGSLNIHGGYIYMNANGDGFDSNGNAVMTDGILIIDGPTNNGNGPLDVNGTFEVSGGYIMAVGSSGMAETPDETSTQYSLQVNFEAAQEAGTLIHLEDAEGETIFTFAPAKKFQSVVFASDDLVAGATYTFFIGGSVSGDASDGLSAKGSTYTAGELYTTLTLEDAVTIYGQGNRMGGGMMGGGRGDRQDGRGMFGGMDLPDDWDTMTDDEKRTYMEANRPERIERNMQDITPPEMELPDGWNDMTEEERQTYMEANRLEDMPQF